MSRSQLKLREGVTLVLGMLLARRQRDRARAWCQCAVVVLNLILIAQLMIGERFGLSD